MSTSSVASIPVITIDGLSASGKGTVAKRVAQVLGFHWLDSGSLYRLTALASLVAGVDLKDAAAVAHIAQQMQTEYRVDGIFLNGRDVSDQLQREEVGKAASQIAVHPEVRAALTARQQAARRAPGLVTDGRDMGTVIFPDADLKVFWTASARVRAERRAKQLMEQGITANIEDLCTALEQRDAQDMNRAIAPLRPAEGSFTIDSTALSIQESVQAVLQLWQRVQTQALG